MSNCCLNTKCIKCCKETNMVLTYHDIEIITKVGYDQTYFVTERSGWFQLKNSHGRCIFHTGDACSIYEHRPEGCTLYPVVYDNDNQCAILDSECPQRQLFSLGRGSVRKLTTLVSTLQYERAERKKFKNNTK